MTESLCLDLNGVIMDTAAALHALSCEISGLDIPPGTFAGKDSVGNMYPKKGHPDQFGEFKGEHYEEAKHRFFEVRRDFFQYAKPVKGAVRSTQIAVARGLTFRIVSDAKRLQETHLREWLHRNKFPHCTSILTRGKEPKTRHQSPCGIVVDNEINQLLGLVKDKGPYLVHFQPEAGEVGSEVKRLETLDPRIMPARGWKEALPLVLQFEASKN